MPRSIISESVREECLAASDWRCSVCGREGVPLGLRHIAQLAASEYNDAKNLQVVCRSCHAMLDRHGMEAVRAGKIAKGGYQLELLACETLRHAGYTVMSGATGPDAGVDLVAKTEVAGYVLTLLVECKWRRRGIVARDVSKFAAKVNQYRASKGLIVTNRQPTASAIDVAQSFGIAIMTGAQLAERGLQILERRAGA